MVDLKKLKYARLKPEERMCLDILYSLAKVKYKKQKILFQYNTKTKDITIDQQIIWFLFEEKFGIVWYLSFILFKLFLNNYLKENNISYNNIYGYNHEEFVNSNMGIIKLKILWWRIVTMIRF